MEIILLERVANLGRTGDVVTVKTGYGRNFLLPKGKAARATPAKLAEFEQKRVDIEARDLTVKKDAEIVAAKMTGLSLILVRPAGDNGHLYGSIKPKDIITEMAAAGYTVVRDQIVLDSPIKELGVHKVRVALHADVSVWVSLNIALSKEEALAMQGKTSAPASSDDSALSA